MTITGVFSAIVIGLVIGALGRLVLPGRQRMTIWLTVLVGIVAAFVGAALARAMGLPTDRLGIDWGELLVQVIVASFGVALVSSMFRGPSGPFRRPGAFGRPRWRPMRRW